jgi:Na+-transporting methylmalonyl-CoA/oxaloacetate decarboxylase gamma subunit
MSKEELHSIAERTTPAEVTIPQSWPGLITWMIGRFGIGVVFLLLLIWVYQDLQLANRAMVDVVRANTSAIEALVRKTDETSKTVERLETEVRRYPASSSQR